MNTIVIYGGRFHPFHKGHFATYQYLTKKYGADSVYVVSSDKTAPVTSPFTFADKKYMMQMLGIPGDKIVQTVSPYRPVEVTNGLDLDNTVLVFAVSEKDTDRFSFAPKKDGSPSYMQPLPKDLSECRPLSQTGYVDIAPVYVFDILGSQVKSASEIREMFIKGDEDYKQKVITELYGRFDPKLFDIFMKALTVTENTLKIISGMRDKLNESNQREYVEFIESVNIMEREANELTEMPIGLNKDEPNNPMIYGAGANPATLNDRKSRALRQLKALQELAAMGQWDRVVTLFPEVQMNVEQVAHGMQELEKVRRKGGKNSRGIDPA